MPKNIREIYPWELARQFEHLAHQHAWGEVSDEDIRQILSAYGKDTKNMWSKDLNILLRTIADELRNAFN